MKRHINKAGGHKIKSPFIKYCTTATACLQIVSVGMCFMLFKTNAVINVDENYNNKATTYNATSVETVINKLEQEVAAEPSINNTISSDANIPGVTNPSLNPNYTDTLDIPDPGSPIAGTIINSQAQVTANRSSKDSWTMEGTVKFYQNRSSIITGRINSLQAISESTTIGQEDALLSFTIGGEVYYAVALVEGFMKACGAYQVILDDGTVFNCVAIDAKSLNDAPGSGAANQIDSTYGHGYYLPSANSIQLSIVEFSDAKTSSTSISHSSAKDYPNAPNLTNRYVKSVHYIKQLV